MNNASAKNKTTTATWELQVERALPRVSKEYTLMLYNIKKKTTSRQQSSPKQLDQS